LNLYGTKDDPTWLLKAVINYNLGNDIDFQNRIQYHHRWADEIPPFYRQHFGLETKSSSWRFWPFK
jgi:hypothetical protein